MLREQGVNETFMKSVATSLSNASVPYNNLAWPTIRLAITYRGNIITPVHGPRADHRDGPECYGMAWKPGIQIYKYLIK